MYTSSIVYLLASATFTSALIPRELLPRADADYIDKACSIPKIGDGTCQLTSDCTTTGFNVAGQCPGSDKVQCCVKKTCGSGGTCQNVGDNACKGSFATGLCPGGDDIKCCEPSSGGGSDPPPDDPPPTTPSGSGASILSAASSQVDKYWYVWGGGGCKGASANGGSTVGFDCSGLTQYAVCQAIGSSKPIPRTAQTQYLAPSNGQGKKIDRKDAEPGDLIFWGSNAPGCSTGVAHVGILKEKAPAGSSGLGVMVNAAHTGTKVRVQDVWESSGGESICGSAVRFW